MKKEWHENPKLQERFHHNYPNDLQVVIHNGGPRLSQHRPELVWVRIQAGANDLYSGEVLNQPEQLEGISQGSTIKLIVPDGGEYPLQVRDKYLLEKAHWIIHPCQQCGLTELFDAPSDLIRVIFPDAPTDAAIEMFTSFCGFCGGVQVIERKDREEDSTVAEVKKTWQFWK